jgi:hypothetical protein
LLWLWPQPMLGDGLSFPVSEAVTGELYDAGQWVEANRVAGGEAEVERRLLDDGIGAMSARERDEVYHHGSPAGSMV